MYMAFVQHVAKSDSRAQFIMEASACLVSSLEYGVVVLLSLEIGVLFEAAVLAGLLGAFLPLHYWLETKGSWDSALVGLGLALITYFLLTHIRDRVTSTRRVLLLGLSWGILTLVSACASVVVFGYVLIYVAQDDDRRRALKHALLACAVFSVVLAPWVIRNAISLGGFVPLRSNLGLELNISNHDGASASFDGNNATGYTMKRHPFYNPELRERIRKMGELEFGREQTLEAKAWIWSHPLRFVTLCAQRMSYFWFPKMRRWWQTGLGLFVRSLAFIGIVLLWRDNSLLGSIFAWLWISFSAIYYLVQVDAARYEYPLWWSQVLLTTYALSIAWKFARSRFGAGQQTSNAAHDYVCCSRVRRPIL
jgi:hypothetical protein